MGKKLAITGHSTRGAEVIELLEMMGGKNCYNLNGLLSENAYYFIGGPYNAEIKAGEYIFGDEDMYMYLLTLEDFLKEYPHKVGDKVVDCYGNSRTIKSMGWLEDLETMVYAFEENSVVLAAKDIRFAYDNTGPTKETITPTPDITAEVTDKNNCDIQCPDGYEFYDEHGNLIGTKVMMRSKKPVYPKTFRECQAILNDMEGNISGYKASLLASLQDLLICRDAYWKIAGEEMGLGKPWKPDWTDLEYDKFCIWVDVEDIAFRSVLRCQHFLTFPTEEMRDAFYENFKDLIEQCKELL